MRRSSWVPPITYVFLVGVVLSGAFAAAQTANFTPLFDGKTLSGWVLPEGADAGNFSVHDGVIAIKGQSGWVHTTREYHNFTLRASVRFLNTDQIGNSGIFMRSPETSSFAGRWPGKMFEVESRDMADNKALSPPWIGEVLRLGGDGGRAPDGTGSYRAAAALAAFRPGEWNNYEVVAQGTRLWAFLNGVLISTADHVADISGHIGLQAETGQTEWRNISIYEHPEDQASFRPLISSDMQSWTFVPNGSPAAAFHDGTVALTQGTQTLRSSRKYGDFTVRFEYRADSDSAAADFVIRASDDPDPQGHPTQGAAVRLRTVALENRTSGPPALVGDPRWAGAVWSLGAPFEFATYDSQAEIDAQIKPGAWQQCQIEVIGDQADISINGHTISHVRGIPLSRGGRLMLVPGQGTVAIRNLTILDLMGE